MIKVGFRKYVISVLLSISLLLVCEIWIGFSAVNESTKNYFNKSTIACEWFSVVFFVTFAIQAIPSLFLPQIIGIKRCIVIGTTFILTGCLLRTSAFLLGYFDSNPTEYTQISFWMAMFGNMIVSLSQCLLNNIPSLVSSIYFEEHQQLTSTTLIVNGSIVGTAIGFIFSPLVMGQTQDIPQMQTKFLVITGVESIISAIVLVASVIIIPSSDAISSEKMIETDDHKPISSRWNHLKVLIKDAFRDMWFLLKSPVFVCLFIIYGCYYSFSSLFYIMLNNIITESLGTNPNFLISYGGSIAVLAGAMFTAILCGFIVRYGSFRTSVIASSTLMFMNALPLFIMYILSYFDKHNKASITILTILYGMVAAPYLSLGYDIMSKAAAPISENIPVTVALIFSNIFSVILSYAAPYVPEHGRNQIFLMIFSCLYIVMGITFFSIKTKLQSCST